MNELNLHPIVRALIKPVAKRLIHKLGINNLTHEKLEQLAETARENDMQGEILFDGDKEQFQELLYNAVSEANKIPDVEERYRVIHFLRLGCLREFVLEEAIQIKQERDELLEATLLNSNVNNPAA